MALSSAVSMPATPAGVRRGVVTRDLRLAYGVSLVVAGLLLVTSAAGLVFGAGGLYGSADPRVLPAFLGQDAITLVAILPLLLGSMWRARHGSVRGLLLWMGALFYVTYGYAYYVLGVPFGPLYPVYIALVSMAGYGLIYLLLSVDAEAVRAQFGERTPRRLAGGFLMGIALLFGVMWVGAIVATLVTGGTPDLIVLAVWPLDLGVLLPASFWAGLWLWRREALGYVAAAVLLVKAGSYATTLVVLTLLGTLWGVALDPFLPAYVVTGAGGLWLTVGYLRSVHPTHFSTNC